MTATGASPSQQKTQQQRRNNGKGFLELFIFVAALATGTASSILSKVMYAASATGPDGQELYFDKPIAQTLLMFIAMLLGLPFHWLVIAAKLPCPGYGNDSSNKTTDDDNENDNRKPKASLRDRRPSPVAVVEDYDATPRIHSHRHPPRRENEDEEELQKLLPVQHNQVDPTTTTTTSSSLQDKVDYDYGDPTTIQEIPWKTYFDLFIPAFFDCTSTAVFMVGLLFLDVSVYQLLRGSGIIFVGLLRQYGLKEHLFKYQWVGLWWNVASAVLVGVAALLDSRSGDSNNNNNDHADAHNSMERVAVGVVFMMTGTLLQAIEFVLEEKYMVADEIKVPPLLFFGMKGFWGVIMTVLLLYPIAYYVPGHDYGSFENFWTAWDMIKSTPYIQGLVITYCFVIFGFNLLCVLVTFLLSSIWHAILDNFRPLTVWCTDLILYYALTANDLGEAWTVYSWLQLAGMAVLIYGTAVYNAPDNGSILLRGEWFSLGMDFSHEYDEIQAEREAQRRFSLGSYPSLQGFLTLSAVGGASFASLNDSIRFGRRVSTLRDHKKPKVYAATHNIPNYSSINLDPDRSQHSI